MEELIEKNMGLVLSIVNKFNPVTKPKRMTIYRLVE